MNRKAVKTILGLVCILGLALTTVATAADPVVIKFGSGAPGRAPISKFMANWCEKVINDSGGALKVNFMPNGVLGKDGQMLERIRSNVAQLGWDIPSYYPGRYPKMDVVNLPFQFDTAEAAGVALWRMYEKGMMDEDAAGALNHTFGQPSRPGGVHDVKGMLEGELFELYIKPALLG